MLSKLLGVSWAAHHPTAGLDLGADESLDDREPRDLLFDMLVGLPEPTGCAGARETTELSFRHMRIERQDSRVTTSIN